MAKWNLTDLEREISDLQDLADKLKAVNAEQARIMGEKNAHIAFLEDQLRRAQEKLRTCRAQALEEAARLIENSLPPRHVSGSAEVFTAAAPTINKVGTVYADAIRSLAIPGPRSHE